METPLYDEYSNKRGYLRWYRELLPVPLRLKNPSVEVPVEELQEPIMQREYHCKMFDLSQPDDLKTYRTIQQRALDGWYDVIDTQRIIDEKAGTVRVWMEWIQNYMEIINGR